MALAVPNKRPTRSLPLALALLPFASCVSVDSTDDSRSAMALGDSSRGPTAVRVDACQACRPLVDALFADDVHPEAR